MVDPKLILKNSQNVVCPKCIYQLHIRFQNLHKRRWSGEILLYSVALYRCHYQVVYCALTYLLIATHIGIQEHSVSMSRRNNFTYNGYILSRHNFSMFKLKNTTTQLAHECEILGVFVNTLRPRQDERHFADDIFTCIYFNENCCILIIFSLKYARKGPIDNNPALVQSMAWRRSGDKPLAEPMMISLPTHICVTRPQWVNAKYAQRLSLLLAWIVISCSDRGRCIYVSCYGGHYDNGT